MLNLFADNLLPVFLAAGAGYLLAAVQRIDPRPLAAVAFYLFAPCLVFQMIAESRLPPGAMLRMVLFAVLVLAGPAALTALVTHRLGWPRPLVAASCLVVLLPNAGNYGLAVNWFAFGDEGLAQAGVFFVTAAIVTFTAGVFIASLGRTRPAAAALGLLRVPAIWAAAVALLLLTSGQSLPAPIGRSVALLSEASIPAFLVILGMQLRNSGLRGPWRPVVLTGSMRLIGGTVVGIAVATVLDLQGAGRQAGVLQSAMPTAVITSVLATQYDVEPAFVTSVVVLTTVVSPLTLTPLLAYLGG